METDLNITKAKQLIGKQWECPFCNKLVVIGSNGISHFCRKHFQLFSLKDLFELEIAKQNMDKKIRELMFYEKEKDNLQDR